MADCVYTIPVEFCVKLLERINSAEPVDMAAPDLQQLLQVAFWASLRTEEGRSAIFTMRVGDRQYGRIGFSATLPADVDHVVKLFPVASGTGCGIAIECAGGEWRIFGIAQHYGEVTIDVRGPGLVCVVGPYQTVGVVRGTRADLVDPILYMMYLDFDATKYDSDMHRRKERIHLMVRSMVSHRHGGAILVVPQDLSALQGLRIGYPLAHPITEARESDAGMLQIQSADDRSAGVAKTRGDRSLQRAQLERHMRNRSKVLKVMGATTAVDGAAVVNRECDFLGFGAMIDLDPRAKDPTIRCRQPFEGSELEPRELKEMGGMRHQSAVRFVATNPGTKAIVASQDGKLTIIIHGGSVNSVNCLEHAEWLMHGLSPAFGE